MRLLCLALLLAAAPAFSAQNYFVDCAAGSDAAAGTSPQAAWKSVSKVSATTFAPGDSVLVRRGTRCGGMLWPKGSGEEGRPIRLSAYGTGALPVIEAGAAEAAVKLFDQHHWAVENIETSGGSPYGIFISGTSGAIRHFRLTNLVVRNVTGAAKAKSSGLVVITATKDLRIEDVEIDGVTAYNTTQWAGIIVNGGSRENRARNVTVRNSIVHDVAGDGIILFQVENGVIEKSAAWLTGLQWAQKVGTPNGIWTWRCRKCAVQLTEGFLVDSPGVDGGVYDIDWGNDDNIVQYNYGHDAMGYCAAIFAAGKETTTNSIIRYNVCVNNGRSPKLAKRQGDIYITTWSGGTLDGVLIHNNTIYWNPPIDVPAIQIDQAEFTGARPNLFRNNVIYSAVPSMVQSNSGLKFERNVYWYGGRGERARLQDGEVFANPMLDGLLRPRSGSPLIDAAVPLPDMGARDAFGAAVPAGKGFDIGAIESNGAAIEQALDGNEVFVGRRNGRWLLLMFAGPESADSRSQLVFLQTAVAQYGGTALDAVVASGGSSEELENLRYDWNLGDVLLLDQSSATEAHRSMKVERLPTTVLVSPAGKIVRRWNGFVTPAELGVTVRHHLGAPAGSPPLKVH